MKERPRRENIGVFSLRYILNQGIFFPKIRAQFSPTPPSTRRVTAPLKHIENCSSILNTQIIIIWTFFVLLERSITRYYRRE